MKFNNIFITLIISVFLFSSCQKDKIENTFEPDILAQETNEPSISEEKAISLIKANEGEEAKKLKTSGFMDAREALKERTSNARNPEVLVSPSNRIYCGSSIRGDNFGGSNQLNGSFYQRGCLADYYSFSAPDNIYYLDVNQTQTYTFRLTGLADDLDLFIFSTFNGYINNCMGYSPNSGISSETITITLYPGNYAVVVDGWISSARSNYTLSANCSGNGGGGNPSPSGCDDFDNLYNGNLTSQTFDWVQWNNYARFDAVVSSNNSYSGRKSIYLDYKSGYADRDQPDVVKVLNEKTWGAHQMNWKMYVPGNRNAMVNFQKYSVPGWENGINIYFRYGRGIAVKAGNRIYQYRGTYRQNTWLDIRVTYDLDSQTASFWVDDKCIVQWNTRLQSSSSSYGRNSLGGVNFDAYHDYSTFYVDDFCTTEDGFIPLPIVTSGIDGNTLYLN